MDISTAPKKGTVPCAANQTKSRDFLMNPIWNCGPLLAMAVQSVPEIVGSNACNYTIPSRLMYSNVYYFSYITQMTRTTNFVAVGTFCALDSARQRFSL